MINPDNTVHSRIKTSKEIEKKSEHPEGVVNKDKFKEVYGVYERKKTKEERAKDWEDVKNTKKKFLSEKEEGTEEIGHKPVSLFDLAKDKKEEEPSDFLGGKNSQAEPMPHKESPFELASHTKNSVNEKYTREMPDLSNVNFMAQAVAQNQSPKTEPIVQVKNDVPIIMPPGVDRIRLQKIIAEIVEHVYQLETKGEVSTVITLGNEKGIFKGVSIKITELDSAKGQLNITIDNLAVPEAKALIDKYQAYLLDALEKKRVCGSTIYYIQQY